MKDLPLSADELLIAVGLDMGVDGIRRRLEPDQGWLKKVTQRIHRETQPPISDAEISSKLGHSLKQLMIRLLGETSYLYASVAHLRSMIACLERQLPTIEKELVQARTLEQDERCKQLEMSIMNTRSRKRTATEALEQAMTLWNLAVEIGDRLYRWHRLPAAFEHTIALATRLTKALHQPKLDPKHNGNEHDLPSYIQTLENCSESLRGILDEMNGASY